ncbi:hypothetical protein BRAS3843_2000014 [Bradyrhizobium sp. STM 3843]|uniref:hypothetical protein n=1 Tax=Bradyrhizobium sp. STM 3843 TaxID=551947 RepID=UPI000240771C|nr:hypothetical protein [Bradyrhizobium sp. STM 3843]CCE07228.1 hypothetical protein BRAS3843_2000014 [Bradyrhizobium sp. STM 3843]
MSAIDAIWNTIKGWATQNATQYVCEVIPHERTDMTGPDDPLVPYKSYMRLWIADMYLAQSRLWFQNQFPAVHTSVGLKFGKDPVKISHVTDGIGQVGPGWQGDYALTDLIPFGGGTVEIQSALLALKGTNYLKESISILKDFSGLIAAPLNQTLDIAEKVSSSMQTLFTGGANAISVGFHKQFVAPGGGAGNVIKPCYIALVAATDQQIDKASLSVKGSRLHYPENGGPPAPLEGYDYLLLRIEARTERDNWRMPNIEEPLNQAIQATLEGDAEKAKQYKTAALLVIWQSPDLAVGDRRRVADAIEAELAELGGSGRGAVGAQMRSLAQIVEARAPKAKRRDELTFSEIVAGL